MSRSLNGPGNGLALMRTEATSTGLADDAALPGGLLRDEVFGLGEGIEFAPAFEGNEASRSAQTFATLVSYTVPENRYAVLRDVSANIDSNGEVRIAVPGRDPVRYTGSIDVSLPFGDAVLLPGSEVLIQHQSTDGNSSTQRGSITAREV